MRPISAALLIAATASAMTAGAAPVSAAALDCTPVRGTFLGQAVPVVEGGQLVGFDVFQLGLTGTLAEPDGTVSAELAIESVGRGGVMVLSGEHRWAGSHLGDVVTSDRVVVTGGGVVNDTQTVVSGGQGVVHTHGSLDPATGRVELSYTGVVCS